MRIARRPLLACATFGALLGPRLAAAADTVRGSGVATAQRREIGAFTGIALGGPFAVVVRTGRREAIEIVADDNILPPIATRLRDGRHGPSLEIELRRDTRLEPRTPIVVTVDCMKVENLEVGGSGSIAAQALKAVASTPRSVARGEPICPSSTPTASPSRSAAAATFAPTAAPAISP